MFYFKELEVAVGSYYSFTALNLFETVSSQTRHSDSREWRSGQTQYINSMIKWIQQSAQKQDKKCGLHSSISRSVYPVKRKEKKKRLWEIITLGHSGTSHLAQLWGTPQTLLVPQFIQLNLPVLPVPQWIPWTWGAAGGRGELGCLQAACPHPPAALQHPPVHQWRFVWGFLGISSFKNFVLKNGSKGKGASWTRRGLWEGICTSIVSNVSSEPRKTWDCFPLFCYSNLPPVSRRCSFSMDLKRSWFTPATAPTL